MNLKLQYWITGARVHLCGINARPGLRLFRCGLTIMQAGQQSELMSRRGAVVALVVSFALWPAPLALVCFTCGLKALSTPIVVPFVPRAKCLAFLVIVFLTQWWNRSIYDGAILLTAASAAAVLLWLWRYFWHARRGEEVSCDDSPAVTACIFLHGLGASPSEVAALAGLVAPKSIGFLWRFPAAPLRCMSVDWGLPRASWFDILAVDGESQAVVLPADINAAVELVEAELAELEARGIPSQRVFLAGFSQGGALALSAALRSHRPLAGVAVFSAFLPQPAARDDAPACAKNKHMPVLWCHGVRDVNVPIHLMRKGVEWLQQAGFKQVTSLHFNWVEFT